MMCGFGYAAINAIAIREPAMKSILLVFLIFAVLALAMVGCLYIFDIKTWGESVDLLVKIEGAIFLLGACSAIISTLVRMKGRAQD